MQTAPNSRSSSCRGRSRTQQQQQQLLPRMLPLALLTLVLALPGQAYGRMAFEKLTDFDFAGTTYYSVKNLSLYECQGWCREEADCQAAAFSFVVNPLSPSQETHCQLQNDSSAANPSAAPQRSANMYYMVKLQLRSENVCHRPWSFERVPNKIIRGLDNALIYTSTKEACLSACLNEKRFICRSVEYDYNNMKCVLSDSDRRSSGQFVQLVDAQGTDYFENLCLKPTQACKNTRSFANARMGVSEEKVAQYVGLHYYTDKELQVTSESACRLACEIESEFLCRSFLYLGQPQGAQYNCRLYHLDHKTLPDGPSTYLNHERPLIDHGEPIGQYFENQCEKSAAPAGAGGNSPPGTLDKIDTLPVSLDTIEDPNLTNMTRNDVNCDKTGTCYDGKCND